MFNSRKLHYLLLSLILLYATILRLYLLNIPFHSTAEGVGSWYGIMARNYLHLPWQIHKGVPVQSIGHWPDTPVRFYSHHPPLMPLAIALSYKLLGQGDWQTRLPFALSTLGIILLLYLLLKNKTPVAALYASAIYASLPMVLYYGAQPEFINPQFIFLTLLTIAAFFRLNANPTIKNSLLLCVAFTLAAATDWPAFYLVPLATISFLLKHRLKHWPLILLFSLFSLFIFAALYTHIVLVATNDWTWMLSQFRARTLGTTPSQEISFLAWLKMAWYYNQTHHTLPILLLSAIWLILTLFRRILPSPGTPGEGQGEGSPPQIAKRKSQIANSLPLFLLLFSLIHLLIGRQGSHAHAWWWWPLTPFLALSSALALAHLINLFPKRLTIPAHTLAILLLILFATINLKKNLPHLLDPNLTSANQPYDGEMLARAVRFASPDANTPVILISGDVHPSLWYYADRPIKMHVWSIEAFNARLTNTTADLPFAFQQDCPARPVAVIVPKLYANAAKDLLAHLRDNYSRLNPPAPLYEMYEIYSLQKN
ncbi:MAG TPA: glycosyltransferase family 39 protein [Tepidisphaeraceae bacterium]|nr:glycosyltransferase family 39 protein [Tepidisphaeraceae bacterium]